MNRPQRLARSVSLAAALVAVGAALEPVRPGATDRPSLDVITIGDVASQLGVKVHNRADEEFALGVQFTGTLAEPQKIVEFGIKGMRVGARVTAARVAPDRVHVEADELDPPSRASVKLRLGPDGKLSLPPRV